MQGNAQESLWLVKTNRFLYRSYFREMANPSAGQRYRLRVLIE